MLVGINCFMLRRMLRFSGSMAKYLRFHHLARLEHVARMRNALLVADLADVHHTFNAFLELNKCAKVRNAGDRAFDGGAAQGTSARCLPRGRRAPASVPGRCRRSAVFAERTTASTVSPGFTTSVPLALHFARP